MSDVFGAGEYTYRYVDGWAKWPDDWSLHDVAAVGVDRNDNVYAFHRGDHPMVVFDRDGSVLRTWGEGLFKRAHGVHVGPDEALYLTDDEDHTVRKCTLEGKVLLTIGVPGVPAPFMSGEPFRRCTHTALSPSGEIYVCDGYGNARVHKYSPDGKRLLSWGQPGAGPGEFNLPHNIACDADGWVYVADRENHRVQVFDGNGKFETQWYGLHRPSGMYMPPGKCPVCYVGEIGPYYEFNRGTPNLGPRVSVLSNEGKVIARIAREPTTGTGPGQYISPHGLAVDSRGDLYVGEVCYTAWPSVFPDTPRPARIRSLAKYEKVGPT
ncbi:MAG TPA: peptidyl-alpha-hydroxyglycine alpha-amidating lyase family protein [Casimicrobiaceae bacterium]|nr:peptidyl-alpha-hydroxyglycine alpha-amidating lyase family protein [Casimicrobiaceae bacterium]